MKGARFGFLLNLLLSAKVSTGIRLRESLHPRSNATNKDAVVGEAQWRGPPPRGSAGSATGGTSRLDASENTTGGALPTEDADARIAGIEKQIAALKAERRAAQLDAAKNATSGVLNATRGLLNVSRGVLPLRDRSTQIDAMKEWENAAFNKTGQKADKGKKQAPVENTPKPPQSDTPGTGVILENYDVGETTPHPSELMAAHRRRISAQRRRRTYGPPQNYAPVYMPWNLPTISPTPPAGPYMIRGTTPEPTIHTQHYTWSTIMTPDRHLAMQAGLAPPPPASSPEPGPAPGPAPVVAGSPWGPAPAAMVIEDFSKQMASHGAAQASLKAAGSATSAAMAGSEIAQAGLNQAQELRDKMRELRYKMTAAASVHAFGVNAAMTKPPALPMVTLPPIWEVTQPPTIDVAPGPAGAAPPAPAGA